MEMTHNTACISAATDPTTGAAYFHLRLRSSDSDGFSSSPADSSAAAASAVLFTPRPPSQTASPTLSPACVKTARCHRACHGSQWPPVVVVVVVVVVMAIVVC